MSSYTATKSGSTLSAAKAYHADGFSVVPVAHGKKKPLVPWKPLASGEHRLDPRDFAAEFERGADVGLLLGAASDGLCVRDFDRLSDYEAWATDHPSYARSLPTATTRRGRHVYWRGDVSDIRAVSHTGSAIIRHPGIGEVKGSGLVVVPPSGDERRWVVPLSELRYVSDPDVTGLMLYPRENVYTSNLLIPSVPSPVHAQTLEQVLEWTTPRGPGERHGWLFEFARQLQSLPGYAGRDPEDLRPEFDLWFSRACPIITTKDPEASWPEFLRAWRDVRHPTGSCIAAIFARTSGKKTRHRLMSLCVELSAVSRGGTFNLDCRTAGALLGVSHTAANRHLNKLIRDRFLELTQEYCWEGALAREFRLGPAAVIGCQSEPANDRRAGGRTGRKGGQQP